VTASQAGNDHYDAAPDVQRTITVVKASTRLTAARAFKTLLGLAKTRFSATLTRSDNGAPIAGQTFAMKVGGSVVCTATTATSGTAGCSEQIGLLAGLLAHNYTAAYAGNANYLGSAATGALS